MQMTSAYSRIGASVRPPAFRTRFLVRKHQAAIAIVVAFLTVMSLPPAFAQIMISTVAGDTVSFGMGTRDGVKVDMTGRVTKQEIVGGSLQTFKIARFKVTQVEPSGCTATLTDVGSGWSVEPGMDVVFDQPLVAPEATPRSPAPTPTPSLPSDPVELLRQGNAAWDRQDWTRAVEYYEELLRRVPDYPVAKGRGEAARDKIESAQRAAEAAQRAAEEQAAREEAQREALKSERENIPLYRETARTYLEEENWGGAEVWLRKIANIDPADAFLRSVLEDELVILEEHLARGRLEEAAVYSQRIDELLFDDEAAALQRRLLEARDQEVIKRVEDLAAKGGRLLEAGDTDGARTAWEEAIRLRPDHAGVAERLAGLPPKTGEVWIGPAIGMRFRYVPAGTFTMGSPKSEKHRESDENQHKVTLTSGVWMGETEVTQGEWRAVMRYDPSHFGSCGSNCPVESVTWRDAVSFANALSRKGELPECYRIEKKLVTFVGLDCRGFRLPTEAEWARSARVGGGDTGGGWYAHNSGQRTHPVGSKPANEWGLYDMKGNVWEWVWDWYKTFKADDLMDPVGELTVPSGKGIPRVIRGSSWYDNYENYRLANRNWGGINFKNHAIGLRLARTAE